jgi:hypothetical protein
MGGVPELTPCAYAGTEVTATQAIAKIPASFTAFTIREVLVSTQTGMTARFRARGRVCIDDSWVDVNVVVVRRQVGTCTDRLSASPEQFTAPRR